MWWWCMGKVKSKSGPLGFRAREIGSIRRWDQMTVQGWWRVVVECGGRLRPNLLMGGSTRVVESALRRALALTMSDGWRWLGGGACGLVVELYGGFGFWWVSGLGDGGGREEEVWVKVMEAKKWVGVISPSPKISHGLYLFVFRIIYSSLISRRRFNHPKYFIFMSHLMISGVQV